MNIIVLVAATLALVFIARDDMPLILLSILMPLSLLAGGCALAAALRPRSREPLLRAGHWILGLLFVLTLAAFRFSADDWTHMLWNVQFPLGGLFFGAGLLLVRVWPADRERGPEVRRGWNGALPVLLAVLVLGAVPILLALPPLEPRMAGRVPGSPLPALLEVVRFGFDRTVPTLMQPVDLDQIARGLGYPPRYVTVPMGATQLAAAYWILFVVLALIGRVFRAGRSRSIFLLLSPLVLAPVLVFASPGMIWERALWRNEPWIVKAYGPTLLAAVVAALVLLVAVRRAERFERETG